LAGADAPIRAFIRVILRAGLAPGRVGFSTADAAIAGTRARTRRLAVALTVAAEPLCCRRTWQRRQDEHGANAGDDCHLEKGGGTGGHADSFVDQSLVYPKNAREGEICIDDGVGSWPHTYLYIALSRG
jgi:hypothetical protein